MRACHFSTNNLAFPHFYFSHMATLDQQSVKKTSGSDGACTACTTASVYIQPGVEVDLSVSDFHRSCVQEL